MHCPKHKETDLKATRVSGDLKAQQCSQCQGVWIPALDYSAWQAKQPKPASTQQSSAAMSPAMSPNQSLSFTPSEFDAKAGFCPECGIYLSRAKIPLKTPFYVERCLSCGGIWCDRGEWKALEDLHLHTNVPQLFSNQWQAQMREVNQVQQERQALIDKLGADLANRLFDLVSILEKHEHGNFAAAYLVRHFDRDKVRK
jgi:Zn-finger nucleic acid-binding protein